MRCTVCGHTEWRSRPDVDAVIRTAFLGSHVQQCLRCGFAQLFPLPDPTVVLEAYHQDYLAEYDQLGESAVINEHTAALQLRDRFEIIDALLPEAGRLLDVGASRGIFMNFASQRGWSVEGIEMERDAIQDAQRQFGLAIQHASIESAHFEPDAFDLIHASHVLEHVYDPLNCIQRMRTWLRPNGLMVLEVPFELGDLQNRFSRVMLGRQPPPNRVPSTHLHFFSTSTLCKLLEASGLDVVQVRSLRRNRDFDSQFPLGGILKGILYHVEEWLNLAPLIEVYAKVPE